MINTTCSDSDMMLPLLSTKEATSQKTALERLATYCFQENHLPTGISELKKQLFLFIVSISGSTLYGIPAYKYATKSPNIAGFSVSNTNLYIIGSWVIGTTIPSLSLLYNSTDIFLTLHGRKKIPKQFQDVLKNKTKTERYCENTVIVSISALASIPLALTSVMYPILDSTAFKIFYGALIQVDNTILHFLPVQLLLDHPVFSAPLKPFRYISQKIRECRLAPAALSEERKSKQRELKYNQLKKQIIDRLTQAQEHINKKTFAFHPSSLSYDIRTPDDLAATKTQPALDSVLTIMRYAPASSNFGQNQSSTSSIIKTLHSVSRKLAYAAGMILVGLSCIGYLASPITQTEKLTGDYTSASAVSTLPIYFLGTLTSFFGGEAMQGLYDYLTSWQKGKSKLPYQAKYYPKSFAFFMLLNLYLSVFSSAAAKELVLANFNDHYWDTIRPFLLEVAEVGISFVVFCTCRDLILTIFDKLATHCGNDHVRLAARLQTQIEQFKDFIPLLDGEQLEESLSALLPNQRQIILGIPEYEYQQIIDSAHAPIFCEEKTCETTHLNEIGIFHPDPFSATLTTDEQTNAECISTP